MLRYSRSIAAGAAPGDLSAMSMSLATQDASNCSSLATHDGTKCTFIMMLINNMGRALGPHCKTRQGTA